MIITSKKTLKWSILFRKLLLSLFHMAGVHECSAKSQSRDKKISTVRATPRYFPAHVSQSDGKRRNLGDEVAKVAAVFSGAWD